MYFAAAGFKILCYWIISINRCFIAGSVASRDNDIDECRPGVQLRLIKADQILDQTRTDAFGDFKFDGLPPNSGVYCIGIFKEGGRGASVAVSLKTSLFAGTIWI